MAKIKKTWKQLKNIFENTPSALGIMHLYYALIFLIISCTSCSSPSPEIINKRFSQRFPKQTGIRFQNTLKETDSLNYFTYPYLYMGGGVAIGDINNDGLADIYFTGNQVTNRLYLNLGNLKFKDITETAKVGGDARWYTGVTLIDINNDGYLDIYCTVSGKSKFRKNQLFVNNQDETFSEKSATYGLDDAGHSIHATAIDYDKDGDLDLYVANYPPTNFKAPNYYYKHQMANPRWVDSDHLYRNTGTHFEDVTEKAGVKNFGLTLSATTADLNEDGWQDLYVSNDFSTPDYLYLNNQDGTFREVVKKATKHTAFFGMGVDIADINNDGYLDIYQVDMDAENNRRKKANMASMNTDLFWSTVRSGFHYQYMHNCMQLHTGMEIDGVPQYTNVSRITGTSSTDWSWAPLLADFNNDGRKDLFVSNGTRREINNNDYFKTIEKEVDFRNHLLQKSLNIPSEKLDNYIFENKGDYEFQKANDSWGMQYAGFSNGAAYADLDNDGDLEIITNNMDDFASVFENHSAANTNWITVALKGKPNNPFGIGARVYITANNQTQMQELTLGRGFQSSVAPSMHFGLGDAKKIDSIRVQWPDGRTLVQFGLKTNQNLQLSADEALQTAVATTPQPFQFQSKDSLQLPTHQENAYNDYAQQVLLPHQMSRLGPALAIGDFNADGLDDFYLGGAAGHAGQCYLQTQQGFQKWNTDAFDQDRASEDIGALAFDADQDGDLDLYVVSGGYEFAIEDPALQDRLYLQEKGKWIKTTTALPTILSSGSRAYSLDYDRDGKQDLLVLGRQIPGKYPYPASSYLLHNTSQNHHVIFKDVTETIAPGLQNIGMATSAVVTDIDSDGWQDFIIVGEWMPICVFRNNQIRFTEQSKAWGMGNATRSWWWSISEGDMDGDGDPDYILGNNGLNYKYQASNTAPFSIYAGDFDGNNQSDIVLGYSQNGISYPVRGRQCSAEQIPALQHRFGSYQEFADARLETVYGKKTLESALHYRITSFASIYLENQGDHLQIHNLPRSAQLSAIQQSHITDMDLDGNLDVIIAGNLYESEVETPRNDAGYGMFLKGNGKGDFLPIPAKKSGLYLPGAVRDFGGLNSQTSQYLLAAKNNDKMQLIAIKK